MLWHFFEISGTIAFALSGALVGISRKMDIFGVFVLSLCTAIGGGIFRDLLVGNIPPNSLRTGLYISITMGVTCILFIASGRQGWLFHSIHRFRTVYLIADTMGLAAFTISGTDVGFDLYPDMFLFSILLGLVTAIGGGIVRDVLARRIPSVLREEVYALPALVGAIIYYSIAQTGHIFTASYIAFLSVCLIRYLAIRYKWNLPRILPMERN